ncbi:MAG TPA: SDR family NAD(P)-dependent oxidoreductase, partial [Polyangia bacterium]|nr:SDR family NAD(P)-dependent oxidoreductase [Polyangia bacterium]
MRQSKDYFAEEGLPEAVVPTGHVVRSLVGQKAIVTGANSGIGRAVALALGHAGADVVVNYVSRPEEAAKVVAEVEACGAHAFAFKADVSQEAEVQ